MPTIYCHCGNALQISQEAIGHYQCPACGQMINAELHLQSSVPQAPVKPAGYPASYHPPTGPQPFPANTQAAAAATQPNPDATIGFVLAIVSFFSCLLAAPFAVVYSMRGMGKPQGQGLAIAGLIIGILQSTVLIGLFVYFAVVICLIGGLGIWGASEIASSSDHDRPLGHEIDVAPVPHNIHASTTPETSDSSIESVAAALQALKADDVLQGRSALQFLVNAEVEESLRSEVVQACLDHVDNIHLQSLACQTVDHWANANDVPQIVKQIQAIESASGLARYGQYLMKTIGKHDAQGGLIPLVTHPNSHVASAATRLAKELQVDSLAVTQHVINAVNDPQQGQSAIDYLKASQPVEQLREQLNQSLVLSLSKAENIHDYREREKIQILKKWGITADALETMFRFGEIETLAKIKSKRSLELLGRALADFPVAHTKAERVMAKIGPAAEDQVWPVLKEKQHVVVVSACRLLGKIGTQRSIPYLESVAEQRMHRHAAERAIKYIREAKRQPTSEWEN